MVSAFISVNVVCGRSARTAMRRWISSFFRDWLRMLGIYQWDSVRNEVGGFNQLPTWIQKGTREKQYLGKSCCQPEGALVFETFLFFLFLREWDLRNWRRSSHISRHKWRNVLQSQPIWIQQWRSADSVKLLLFINHHYSFIAFPSQNQRICTAWFDCSVIF